MVRNMVQQAQGINEHILIMLFLWCSALTSLPVYHIDVVYLDGAFFFFFSLPIANRYLQSKHQAHLWLWIFQHISFRATFVKIAIYFPYIWLHVCPRFIFSEYGSAFSLYDIWCAITYPIILRCLIKTLYMHNAVLRMPCFS